MPRRRETPAYRGPDRRNPSGIPNAEYRGSDRRATAPLTRERLRHRLGLRTVILAVALLLIVVLVLRAEVIGGEGVLVTFVALRDAGAGLLVLSGSVLMVLWGITGRAGRALDGSALLLVGGGMLTLAGPWAAWLHHDEYIALLAPGARLALCLPAIAVFARSDRLLSVDSSVHPLHTLPNAIAAVLGLLGVEAIVRVLGPLDGLLVWVIAFSVIGVGWVGVGVQRVLQPDAQDGTDCRRMVGFALVAWGLGDFALTFALSGELRWGVAGAAAQLVGASLATWAAVSLLLAQLGLNSARRLRLAGELADVSSVLADEKAVRQTLVHDARNVVAAIRTANVTLERHGERLDPATQAQLRDAIGTEFTKLQSLLEPANPASSRITS